MKPLLVIAASAMLITAGQIAPAHAVPTCATEAEYGYVQAPTSGSPNTPLPANRDTLLQVHNRFDGYTGTSYIPAHDTADGEAQEKTREYNLCGSDGPFGVKIYITYHNSYNNTNGWRAWYKQMG